MKIAIDGPAGAGKSTIARKAAARLGFIYVDTGAMYRSVALFMLDNGIDPEDQEKVEANVKNADIKISYIDNEQVILLNGKNVNKRIRTPEVSQAASSTSRYAKVREHLLSLQRDIAETNSVIMDGRDIGTVILPDAELKIFLTASPEVRGERRYRELIEKGGKADLSEIIEDIRKRDRQDSERENAPLKKADDAVLIDSSNMTIDEVVSRITDLASKKRFVNEDNHS